MATLSMTGFGRTEYVLNGQRYVIEIKSLNSKQMDIYTKIPSQFKSKEIELRNTVSQIFERGKVDLSLWIQQEDSTVGSEVNQTVVAQYFKQIQETEKVLGIHPSTNYMEILLRMPEVFSYQEKELQEGEWEEFMKKLSDCTSQVLAYRKTEGDVLKQDLTNYINTILHHLEKVKQLEEGKSSELREKMLQKVSQYVSEVSIDKNRLEQEVLYYIEKMDISEEKVRLHTNCTYFLDTLDLPEAKGRKLGFISQEIGREINTIGSKCNDSAVQKHVVEMKDCLEKIKEQCANVL